MISAIVVVLTLSAGCSTSKASRDTESTASASAPTSSGVVGASDPVLIELTGSAGHGDPNEVRLPSAAPEAAAWLRGQGAPAVTLVVESTELWQAGQESCGAVAASLDAAGTPDEFLAAASGIPDAATRDVLVGLNGEVGKVLRACRDDAQFAAALPDFAWQWSLARRRLSELGVLP